MAEGRGVKQNGVERDIVYTSTDGREGVSKITIIIGIEHYTPTSLTRSSNPKPPPPLQLYFLLSGGGKSFYLFVWCSPTPANWFYYYIGGGGLN